MNNQGLTPNLPLWSFQFQSNSNLVIKSRKDLEIHLITRALKDEEFKQSLLENPKALVERELGSKLPEELEIKVLQEVEDTIYIVFPSNPYEGVSEEDLRASLGMTYEDVAQWILEQHRNTFLDREKNVSVTSKAWKDQLFRSRLLDDPGKVLCQELNFLDGDELENLDLNVLMENSNTIYITLPAIQSELAYGWILSDLQLESAAGLVIGCVTDTGFETVGSCGS